MVNLIKLQISKDQLKVLTHYIGNMLEAKAFEGESLETFLKFLREFDYRRKKKGVSQDFTFTYDRGHILWQWLKAVLDDKIILAPADQTQASLLMSDIAKQLDVVRDYMDTKPSLIL